MTKKIFGLALVGILVSILVVNIIQDQRKKKQDAAIQEQIEAQTDIVQGLTEGEMPIDFELQTLNDEVIKLSEYKGKKVILNFWATWCPPCQAEMPHMENFYKKKAEEYNLEILAVNLTNDERVLKKRDKVQGFIDEYGLTFPVPLDEDGDIGYKYKILAIPTTYFINSDGTIHKKITGPMDEQMIEYIVKDMD